MCLWTQGSNPCQRLFCLSCSTSSRLVICHLTDADLCWTYKLCTLLDTCGRYFAKGTAKRKLDRFLTFFQRYILSKPSLTMDMEFDLADLFERLRPDLKRCGNISMNYNIVGRVNLSMNCSMWRYCVIFVVFVCVLSSISCLSVEFVLQQVFYF